MTLQQYLLILSDSERVHLWPAALKLKCTLVSFYDFMHYSSSPLWSEGPCRKMKHIVKKTSTVMLFVPEKSASFVTLLLGPVFSVNMLITNRSAFYNRRPPAPSEGTRKLYNVTRAYPGPIHPPG